MLPYFSVTKFCSCHLLRIRRGGTLCGKAPVPLPNRAEPVHKISPSPTSLMNQPACWIWPRKIYLFYKLLCQIKLSCFPFHLAKPGLRITGEISQDFSYVSNSEQLKRSWGWGVNLYCRPLKSWYTLEGKHWPTVEWLLAWGRQWERRSSGTKQRKKKQREKKTEGGISLASKGRAVDFRYLSVLQYCTRMG